ncbi:MAG TPA: hypothetical protein VGV69_09765, partial [Solirubrobacterales bacterium]|nr:hypothetical protein [Solirubrobacterales bacterium]
CFGLRRRCHHRDHGGNTSRQPEGFEYASHLTLSLCFCRIRYWTLKGVVTASESILKINRAFPHRAAR